MRKASYLTILTILIAGLAVSASAQRTRRTTPRPTPKPTPAKTPVVTAEVSAAKQQVSNQLHNVNVFVDILGPVAVGLEDKDKQAAARRLDKKAMDDHDLAKRKTIAAIRGLRDGLVALETDFRTKPQLAAYLPKIQGISTLCTQSEDSAIAGRFVAAKEPLRQVALKLNETLAVMPGQPSTGIVPPSSSSRTVPIASTQSKPSSGTGASTSGREPAVGMTFTQVLQSSWGDPANKRSSKTANGTTEVWTYAGNRTIYFFNGKVTQIVR